MNKLVIALALVAAVAFAEEIAVSTKMIREINQRQKLWRASHNHITRLPKSQARSLLGLNMKNLEHNSWEKKVYSAAEVANAPDEFDSRTNWPNCASMKDIRDQRQCGSCWAFGAVEAMSDRICVVTTETVRLSAEDVTSCSGCGSCSGGQPSCAWEYWVSTGIVTEQCLPYASGAPCTHKCTDPSIVYEDDKHKGAKAYTLTGEENIKTDVSTHGPLEVGFHVYADFMSYSSGIYHHVSGGYEGGHAIKLIGYGVENGVKYWICANSWGSDWGEKGYFRILRGSDECGIESNCWSGIPAA